VAELPSPHATHRPQLGSWVGGCDACDTSVTRDVSRDLAKFSSRVTQHSMRALSAADTHAAQGHTDIDTDTDIDIDIDLSAADTHAAQGPALSTHRHGHRYRHRHRHIDTDIDT